MTKTELLTGLDSSYYMEHSLGLIPDPWQKKALQGQYKRLLMNCSRQSGKSTVAAVKAVHEAIFKPEQLVLLISRSLRQSQELFKKCSDFIDKSSCSLPKTEDNRLSCRFTNKSRILSLPGAEQNIRGYSPTLIIIDESARVDDTLYYSLRPMLSVSGGSLWGLSTPFGMRGWFWEAWTKSKEWEKVKITALQCDRITAEFLEEEKLSLGQWWYQQEYMCEFLESEDSIFEVEEFDKLFSDDIKPMVFEDDEVMEEFLV